MLQGAQLPLLDASEAERASCHEGKDCLHFRAWTAAPHTAAVPQTKAGGRAVQGRGE